MWYIWDRETDRVEGPISMEEYLESRYSAGPNRVAHEEAGGFAVSTVFLGLSHTFMGEPGLFFETMVFSIDKPVKGDNGKMYREDHYQTRYDTPAQARQGHEDVVRLLKHGEKPEGWYSATEDDTSGGDADTEGDPEEVRSV